MKGLPQAVHTGVKRY